MTYEDLNVISASGALYYTQDRTIIDLISGAYNQPLGHCNWQYNKIVKDCITNVQNCYRCSNIAEKNLKNYLNSELNNNREWYFQTTGAEAIEKAVLNSIGKHKAAVIMENSFHGKLATVSFAHYSPNWNSPIKIYKIAWMDFNGLKNLDFDLLLIEPIQGSYANRVETSDFEALREICDDKKAILIADEVLCGSYRCGHLSISETMLPNGMDIIVLSKGLAGSIPLSAIGSKKPIKTITDWYTTNAGNSLSLNIATEHLPIVKDENGKSIISIYGKNLVNSITYGNFILIPTTKPKVSHENLLDKGILVGYSENFLRIAPCLNISPDLLNLAIDKINSEVSKWR